MHTHGDRAVVLLGKVPTSFIMC